MEAARLRSPAFLKQIEFYNILKVLVITSALTAITRLAIEQAQKRTQKKITPFKGNTPASLAFTGISTSYLAFSLLVSGPLIKSPAIPPPQVEDPEPPHVEEDPIAVEEVPPVGEMQLVRRGGAQRHEVEDRVRLLRSEFLRALQNQEVQWLRQEVFLGGRQLVIEVDLHNPVAVGNYLGACNALLGRARRLPDYQRSLALEGPSPFRAAQQREWEQQRVLHQTLRGPRDDYLQPDYPRLPIDFLEEIRRPPGAGDVEDFVLVERSCMPEIGVSNEHLFGTYGELMRLMLFRNLLNEYSFLLREGGVDLEDTKGSQELEAALFYLTRPSSAKDAKEQYERFVAAHEALILAEKTPEVAKVCQAMAIARMTPRIQSFQEDFVAQHIGFHDPVTLQNFVETFVQRNKEIAVSNPRMRVDWWTCNQIKLYGSMSWSHYLMINPPQLRNQEDGIGYLRHATPNKWDPQKGVIIDPLYREFLRSVDGFVLYAAHQRLQDDGCPENEDVRCQTLVQLEREQPNLLLLFQSVENTLFKKGALTFEELKTRLIDSFYQTEGHRLNRLPLRLQEDINYRKKMEEICDFIHRVFFNSRVNVQQDSFDFYGGLPADKRTTEWQVFILLFYYYQREGIKSDFDVRFVNTGCKDDFDRGGGQNIVSDIMHLLEIFGLNIPAEELQAVMDSVQAPTLQLKGTEPIKYRIHPALCLVKLILSLSKEKIREIQRRGRVKEIRVEKRDEQSAIFLPKYVRTLSEYQRILTALQKQTYTLSDHAMIASNDKFPKESIIGQLERNYANGLMVDGYVYDGSNGWFGHPYTIAQIYKELTETHLLPPERAVRLMNQLEVQIFATPFERLQMHFQTDQFVLRGARGQKSPIALTTTEVEHFVVKGTSMYEIIDMNRDGACVATLGVNVTLHFPKSEEGQEMGEWSWSILAVH
ncbi:MAG: hypothetical protein KDK64_02145 [Chlamydiia bacterium]|nr:hypothetical protein [Chlamydiia bacterium]